MILLAHITGTLGWCLMVVWITRRGHSIPDIWLFLLYVAALSASSFFYFEASP